MTKEVGRSTLDRNLNDNNMGEFRSILGLVRVDH